MRFKITTVDRKILHLLSENARIPDSVISRKVGVSRETARYRIRRLLSLGIITGFTAVCSLEKMGFSAHHLLITLRRCDEEAEQEIVNTLSSIPLVNYVSTLIGDYDVLVECSSRTPLELNDVLRGINERFGEKIQRIHINTVLQEMAFPHNYLLEKVQQMGELHFPRYAEQEVEEIDPTSRKILALLSKNARASNMELARKSGVSSDTVIYRRKQMEHSGLIQGYKAIIDPAKVGRQRYVILLKTQGTERREKALVGELRMNGEALYLMRCIGEWNIVVDMCFSDVKSLREVIRSVRGKYGDIITADAVLIHFQEHKNVYFPDAGQQH